MSNLKWSDNEWEERFDVLFNNITSNQAPGLNTYEKCVFLTKGQDEVIKNHFSANSKGNSLGQGFDDSVKRQIDFSMLTTSKSSKQVNSAALFDTRSNSKSITLPSGIMMIINEIVQVKRSNKTVDLIVEPLKFTEYNRLMLKPYKRPAKNQAWRLIDNDVANKADIIVGPDDTISKYIIRYIRQPKPIIIGDLDGFTINGYEYGEPTEENPMLTRGCELDPMLYEEILQRAVEIAKIAWQGDVQTSVTMGARSE